MYQLSTDQIAIRDGNAISIITNQQQQQQ